MSRSSGVHPNAPAELKLHLGGSGSAASVRTRRRQRHLSESRPFAPGGAARTRPAHRRGRRAADASSTGTCSAPTRARDRARSGLGRCRAARRAAPATTPPLPLAALVSRTWADRGPPSRSVPMTTKHSSATSRIPKYRARVTGYVSVRSRDLAVLARACAVSALAMAL